MTSSRSKIGLLLPALLAAACGAADPVPDASAGPGAPPSASDAATTPPAPFSVLPVVPTAVNRIDVPNPAEPTGGLGSGLAYDPADDLYWMLTDSPPAGTEDWPLYVFRVQVQGGRAEIRQAVPLVDGDRHLRGSDLDPEGIALAPDGTLWLCDEKGPFLVQVSRQGRILKKVQPTDFLKGRQSNRGFEGVAVTPDGAKVFAVLQNGVDSAPDKLDTVIAEYDVASGSYQLHPYRLEDDKAFDYPRGLMIAPRTGAHDLHLLGPRTLLVLERDNQAGADARVKRIFRVELPATPASTPLPKTLVLDLRAHGYDFEQPEGLTLRGPRRLAVINDNDALPDVPTQLWEIAF